MKRYIFLIPLLLGTSLNGYDKTDIDTLVAHILAPRHVGEHLVVKSPFVDGATPVAASAKKRTTRLELQGVVNKKALINGQLYRVGDTVRGYQIQTITEKGVTLLKNSILYSATLTEGGSKIQIKRDR